MVVFPPGHQEHKIKTLWALCLSGIRKNCFPIKSPGTQREKLCGFVSLWDKKWLFSHQVTRNTKRKALWALFLCGIRNGCFPTRSPGTQREKLCGLCFLSLIH